MEHCYFVQSIQGKAIQGKLNVYHVSQARPSVNNNLNFSGSYVFYSFVYFISLSGI